MIDGMIAVWFSCGAASAVAAKLTILKYPNNEVRIVNNPVAEEDEDNRRFLLDVQDWIGKPIEEARNSKFPDATCDSVWKKERLLSTRLGAPCTKYLKKRARQEWENVNKPNWHVLGFTAEEEKRHRRFILTERDNVIPILIDNGITKEECAQILTKAGLRLPRIYSMGYPNANCIGCVKATSPTYWNHVRKVHPDVFAERARQAREYCKSPEKLVRYKGQRITLDQLPEDAVGLPMRSLKSNECGIFCEEKP